MPYIFRYNEKCLRRYYAASPRSSIRVIKHNTKLSEDHFSIQLQTQYVTPHSFCGLQMHCFAVEIQCEMNRKHITWLELDTVLNWCEYYCISCKPKFFVVEHPVRQAHIYKLVVHYFCFRVHIHPCTYVKERNITENIPRQYLLANAIVWLYEFPRSSNKLESINRTGELKVNSRFISVLAFWLYGTRICVSDVSWTLSST